MKLVVPVAAVCVLASSLATQRASADWPLQRHDAARTGLASGSSNIQLPVPYFRHYLGGSLGQTSLITYDVDGDGTDDIVYSSGGSVHAKRSNDSTIWQTPPLGLGAIAGIADLDGDGADDLVVYARGRSVVLELSSGAVQWLEPDNEMGTLGGIAIGDLNGDNLPDLLMEECGCCGVNSGNTGYVYSFAGGFGSPTLLWQLPYAACGATRSLTLVDADGTPPLEVMNNTNSAFHIVAGASGAVLASTANLGSWIGSHYCRGHDVDGQPGDEILCVQNVDTLPAIDQRRITVLKYSAGTLSELWPHLQVAPDAGGDASWVDPFIDLDADGTIEIVIATKDASDVWSTRVFDAASGAELGTIVGEKLVGTAAIEEPTRALLLTTSGTTLHAHAFDAGANPTTSSRWSLADVAVLTQPDWALRPRTQLYSGLVTRDLDGDGTDELIVRTVSGAVELRGYSATGGQATLLASYALAQDVDILNAWVLPPIDTLNPQVAIATNDGFLTLFNDQLQPTNTAFGGPGIRIGGYYAAGGWRDLQRTPTVAALDGGAEQAIVVRDSRSALLRLDASQALLNHPPEVLWQATKTLAGSIVDGLDGGAPGVVAFGIQEPVSDPPAYLVRALRANGSVLFVVPLGGDPMNDILPASLDGDGVTDLVFQWGNPTDTLQQTRGISGVAGATLWNAVPLESGAGRQPAGLAVADWNGDTVSDVFLHGASTHRVHSGVDGAQIGTSAVTGGSYHIATVYDVDGDAVDEITLHGSNNQPRTLSHDLQTQQWIGSDDDRPYPYGAIAPCSSGPILVEGSWANPARLKLTELTGPSAGTYLTMVLAGGQTYANEAAAQSAGEYLGQLTSATVHEDLTGAARPSALVGSTDGWLYAIDPCGASIDFAVDFGTAVGEAVYGDTDGDGRDEILVSAADGFLYGLRHNAIDAPSDVLDTDPPNGFDTQDVDTIVTTDTLYGSWQPVAGAASYEVAIVEDGGDFVTSPVWLDVGTDTTATLSGLPLQQGGRYLFLVRTINNAGDPSFDVASDGVVVTLPGGTGGGGPGGGGTGGSGASSGQGGSSSGAGGSTGSSGGTTGTDEGCGCRVVGQSKRSEALLLALLLATAALARRRRRAG